MNKLVRYFLKLGTIGFGGPAALVGYMRRDLVEERQLVDEPTYNLSIALAQIMPGPLAAQTAMAIGYFRGGVIGATMVGLAFILPSFLMVLGRTYVARRFTHEQAVSAIVVSYYWHFVDVVWIGLFTTIYLIH